MKKIAAVGLISLMLNTNIVFAQNYNNPQIPRNQMLNFSANPYQADAQSQRIPAGKRIRLKMETPINTHNSAKGAGFNALLVEDIKGDNSVILPAGTYVRGRVKKMIPNGFFSKGAQMMLSFDHAVTPLGRQVALTGRVSDSGKYQITEYGYMSAGGGWISAVEKNLDQSVDLGVKIAGVGVKSGLSLRNKLQGSNPNRGMFKKAGTAVVSSLPVIVLTPVAVAGGAVVGSGVFFGESVISAFKKGGIVQINPGDIIEVTLSEPMDVPIN